MPFVIQRSQEEIEPGQVEEEKTFEIERAPEKPKSRAMQLAEDIGKEYVELGEIGKTGGKSFLKGVQKFGRIMGPLQDFTEEEQQQFEEALEQYIPTRPEEEQSFLEKGLGRGLEQFPQVAGFPGGGLHTLPQSIAAGFLGEGAKELGAPEWAQTAAELTAYIGPDITKKLLETGSNKDLIKIARDFGLKDEQIVPLIQGDFKKKWLSKVVPKRGRTQEVLKNSKKALENVYETLENSPEAFERLTGEADTKWSTEFENIFQDLPQNVAEEISKDYEKFKNKPLSARNLMNFFKKVNKAMRVNKNAYELVRFKEPTVKALTEINPDLSKEFQNVTNLYSRYADIAGKLKPGLVSDLVSAAEAIGILGTTIFGDYVSLSKILAEQEAKIGARELLLNPRLQQLGEKALLSLNNNKFGMASKIFDQMNKEIKKMDDSIELETYTQEDLKNLFKD